LYQM